MIHEIIVLTKTNIALVHSSMVIWSPYKIESCSWYYMKCRTNNKFMLIGLSRSPILKFFSLFGTRKVELFKG